MVFKPQRAYTQLWKDRKLSQRYQPGDVCSHLDVIGPGAENHRGPDGNKGWG